jgi:ribosome-binding protein aMBF1 (putative translation factor)
LHRQLRQRVTPHKDRLASLIDDERQLSTGVVSHNQTNKKRLEGSLMRLHAESYPDASLDSPMHGRSPEPASRSLLRSIGARIATIRRDRFMSQQQLAQAIGVSKSLIAHIEHGRIELSVTNLMAIARVLHVKPHRLL